MYYVQNHHQAGSTMQQLWKKITHQASDVYKTNGPLKPTIHIQHTSCKIDEQTNMTWGLIRRPDHSYQICNLSGTSWSSQFASCAWRSLLIDAVGFTGSQVRIEVHNLQFGACHSLLITVVDAFRLFLVCPTHSFLVYRLWMNELYILAQYSLIPFCWFTGLLN